MSSYQQIPRDELDQRVFQATLAFLAGRLPDAESLLWAIRLRDTDQPQRNAVRHLMDQQEGRALAEPWSTSWRLIQESWNTAPVDESTSANTHGIRLRLRAGERSGAIIDELVAAVAPTLKVSEFSDLHLRYNPRRIKIRTFRDLFSARVSSGRSIAPAAVELQNVSDSDFLTELAVALESSVQKGLGIARRLGWDGDSRQWILGQLHRAYFVPHNERTPDTHEPDQFHTGLAPCTKLLHATVERLAELDRSSAIRFLQRWRTFDSPLHVRLWAAMARDPALAPAGEVGQFLISQEVTRLWNVYGYPEIAELRARRFSELDRRTQIRLLGQIRRGPARSYWPTDRPADKIAEGRLWWIARELRRLAVAGFRLPEEHLAWLNAHADQGPPPNMRLDEGFPSAENAHWVGYRHEARYDELRGVERLAALEVALGSSRSSWTDDPAEAARGWIRETGHALLVLDDLESAAAAGAAYPKVWERFGWSHSFHDEAEQIPDAQRAAVERVLALLIALPNRTLRDAIEGLAEWAFSWSKVLATSGGTLAVWARLWPLGVEATNARTAPATDVDLESVIRTTATPHSVELDTLNSPTGKLIEVFLRSCPSLENHPAPFVEGPCRTMRDTILTADGLAGTISRYRLVERIGYFLRADRQWAQRELLQPLQSESAEALHLWQALGRRIHRSEVLEIIGDSMAERAVDTRLERDTREALTANLVIEGLYSIKEQREPVVAVARISQTLRAVEDEVRASAADVVRRFVSELSATEQSEDLVRDVVIPFLRHYWPQERSLTTPGVARAFAQLPAVAGGALSDAVAAIERFLVPFDCWSLADYDLTSKDETGERLPIIDSPEKARALLQLLACTIGRNDRAVIPNDLSDALWKIRSIEPDLATTPDFRRLATSARRT